jgi:hypothetical protein
MNYPVDSSAVIFSILYMLSSWVSLQRKKVQKQKRVRAKAVIGSGVRGFKYEQRLGP